MTQEDIHSFLKGWTSNLNNNAESTETFTWGVNGRLYSENGTLSFHSIEGTLPIYSNPNIVKYLGHWGFKNELICFVKALPENETSENTPEELAELEIETQSCVEESGDQIDFASYFEYVRDEGYQASDLNCDLEEEFENNTDYVDQIISLRYDNQGNMYQVVLWSGDMNFKIESKIVALGLEENAHYKRVYFTDNINYFHVVNLKDKKLQIRRPDEFNVTQSPLMLQPRIEAITDEGQLPAMAVIYVYHLISDNGQVTGYSPASDIAYIVKDDSDESFQGGSTSEVTSKSVEVKLNLIDIGNYAEVECIAIEFEGKNVPTNIKSLGLKKIANVVVFKHTGVEAEYSENITLADIFQNKANWKYCATLETKNNKLLAGGLRNEPISDFYNKLKMDFALHGWNYLGQTHHCPINPDPRHYSYIDHKNNNPVYLVTKKIYNSIVVFRDFKVRFKNDNGDFIETELNTDQESYIDRTDFIYNWLKTQQVNNPQFNAYFPNLKILLVAGQLILKREVDAIQTDISEYYFQYSTTQVIESVDYEKEYTANSATSGKVRGYKTAGFNSGNGIQITFREVKDDVLEQANEIYDGSGNLMNLKKPSLKRTFVKGEIYRLGALVYNKKTGEKLFVVPMGDIAIPMIGESKAYLSPENVKISSGQWVNQSVSAPDNDGIKTLRAHRVELDVRVRFNCRTKEDIGVLQIMHVERTPENRTILAQGISAPLMRMRNYESNAIRPRYWPSQVRDTWMLPYYGGPATELNALLAVDELGINVDTDTSEHPTRVLQARDLFYFDSPDFIYGKTPTEQIASCKVKVVGRLNTDHTPGLLMNSGRVQQSKPEEYPKFSRKIYAQQLLYNNESDNYPFILGVSGLFLIGAFDYWINVSVFTEFELRGVSFDIKAFEPMLKGQIVSGENLELDHSLSNIAYCLPSMNLWYGSGIRKLHHKESTGFGSEYQYAKEMIGMGNISEGYSTVFIRTESPIIAGNSRAKVFNPSFWGTTHSTPDPLITKSSRTTEVYDGVALINLQRNNEDSIFGGRTEIAFSKNEFIPLSETIPIRNVSHRFFVQGDAYTTLFNRLKNDFGENDDDLDYGRQINNGDHESAAESGDLPNSIKRHWGAWCYSVILETMVEPKLSHEYEWYRQSNEIDFKQERKELLNEAYLNTNNFKRELPKPYRFKDDPNLNNILSASKVKLSGDFYDSWTEFLTNEFYELDKDAGNLTNLVKQDDQVFAIQERQTSLMNIDRDTMIPTSDGSAINVRQGAGKSIDGHQIISQFGTNIRRAVVKSDKYGFHFWDENKNEFVKVKEGLLTKNFLHLKIKEMFKDYEIVDTESYFDFELKETNIRIRSKHKNPESLEDKSLVEKNIVISYNEIQQAFNGVFEYNDDIYMNFQEKVITAKGNKLERLNDGKVLQISGENKTMTLGFVSNKFPQEIKQFVHLSGTISSIQKAKRIYVKTSTGQERTILGDHPKYQIKEGNHSLPLKNMYDSSLSREERFEEKATLRGTWAYIEMEFASEDYEKIDIFVLIAHLRKSFV